MNDWNNFGASESHTDVYLQTSAVSGAIDTSLRNLQDKAELITLEQLSR